ncbi:hypothetical protein GCM10010259_28160 [Streptomyces daghestanicus]|uniref:PucR family transcriptional regulator n=1 Tax=Streptomyces daghestanicus TaxID=66885 RepID=A0ABQ3QA02_9ACTN|nr:hypothetical protein GCM10010259_28160 [Streptomyces daghestanicus]GHI34084.1 hypothetical protein Sdagh_58140 [Streptomyces daghestanicus]
MSVPQEPAVPPTPPVPLATLLAREDLDLRELVAAGDTVVHGAHASEMADPVPYLLGGELLLTAGAHGPGAADPAAYWDGYAARITAAGGAALGFGVAPVHPGVPPELVAACAARGLPLIEVGPGTAFAAVARAVWQLMARERLAELRRIAEAQQSLTAAAGRPDAVPAVLHRLAARLGGRAVLYGPDGAEAAGTAEAPDPALAELARRVARSPSATATAVTGDEHLAAYALGGGRDGLVLGVATPGRRSGDHTIASVAAVLLTLLTGRPGSRPGEPRTTALVRLLLGASPAEVAHLLGDGGTGDGTGGTGGRADGAGDRTDGASDRTDGASDRTDGAGDRTDGASDRTDGASDRTDGASDRTDGAGDRTDGGAAALWYVVHARPTGPAAPDPVTAAALGAALGSPLVDPAGDVVRVLLPATREPAPQPGWTLGVSAPAEPAGWPAADAEAARALARARATRVPLLRHTGRPALSALVPAGEAAAYARALLAPVAAVPALPETLRTWLSLHGGWDRTAVALGVHRNTVRQRIARCAALLGADLDDPDVRMELWFALRQR